MPSLAWMIGASLLLALGFWFASRGKSEAVIARFAYAYLWILVAVLGLGVASYLGLGRTGSPKISSDRLVRVQYRGLYVREDHPFAFYGSSNALERRHDGFVQAALAADEWLEVGPKRDSSGGIGGWWFRSNADSKPLRVDRLAVNGGIHWLKEGDSFRVAYGRRKRWLGLSYQAAKSGFLGFGHHSERFLYEQGSLDKSGFHKDSQREVAVERSPIQDWLTLSDLLSRPEISGSWNAVSNKTYEPEGFVAGLDKWSMLKSLVLVRERSADGTSRLGLLANMGATELAKASVYYNNTPVVPTKSWTYASSNAGPALTVGVGVSGLSLSLPSRPAQESGRSLLKAYFTRPVSWQLPPERRGGGDKPMILTSGGDQVPMDGYSFDVGNPNHPFYGKAWRQGPMLMVSNGQSSRTCAPGDVVPLGDNDQGVLVGWKSLDSPVPYAGPLALGLLVLAAIAATGLVWSRRDKLNALDVAWLGAWGLALTLLVIRLVLTYRGALLPPDDATPHELASMQAALTVALQGLALMPLASLAAAALACSRASRKWRIQEITPEVYRIAAVVPTAFVVLAWILRQDNTFLHIARTSIITHLLIVGVVALLAPKAVGAKTPAERQAYSKLLGLAVWVPVLGVMFLLKDFGFFVYIPGVAAATILARIGVSPRWRPISTWSKQTRTIAAYYSAVTAVVLAVMPFMYGMVVQKVVQPYAPAAYYRILLSTRSSVDPVLDPEAGGKLQTTTWQRNEQQTWQVGQYVVLGSSRGPAYGKAPLSKVGMTYSTTQSDTAFATFLVSEHGIWTSVGVLVLLLGLACSLGVGAVRLPPGYRARAVPLLAIAGYYAFNGPYMAAANTQVPWVPFTGQNVPLLGMESLGDVVQSTVLLAIASYLLLQGRNVAVEEKDEVPVASRWTLRVLVGLGGLLTLGTAAMLTAASKDTLRPYDMPEPVLQRVAENAKRLKLSDALLLAAPSDLSLTPFERENISRFNRRPNKTDSSGGLYYVRPVESSNPRDRDQGYELAVNEHYYRLENPLMADELTMWEGNITAPGRFGVQPTLYMLRSPLSLSMASSGAPTGIRISSENPVSGSSSVSLVSDQGDAYCEIERTGNSIMVSAKRQSAWKVFCEGKEVGSGGVGPLKVGDILVIEDYRPRRPKRINMIYLGADEPRMAFVQWRNGAIRRVLARGDELPMLYAMGKAGDSNVRAGKSSLGDLRLSVEPNLHHDLQVRLDNWVAQNRDYSDEDPMGKRVAATFIDATTGEVLAMPSWPKGDPTSDDFESEFAAASHMRQLRMIQNHNLTDHAIGSTTKPLTIGVISSAYARSKWPNGKAFSLDDLRVLAWENPHLWLGASKMVTDPDTAYMAPVQAASMDMTRFIVQSYDWPAVILGSMGLVKSTDELARILAPVHGGKADVVAAGNSYQMNLLRAKDPLLFHGGKRDDEIPGFRTRSMSDALLFKGYRDLYGVEISSDPANEVPAEASLARQFLPLLASDKEATRVNRYLDDALPDRVRIECNDMQSLRAHLVSFLVGSGMNRWNNVMMAQSYARLITGKRVEATLSRRKTKVSFAAMPYPVSDADWRERRLLKPMEGVAGLPGGTAYGSLTALQSELRGHHIRLLLKTGTVQNRDRYPGERGVPDSETLAIVMGKTNAKGFVPGLTVTGYLFMEDAKTGSAMRKFGVAAPLIRRMAAYLDSLEMSK